MFPHEDYPDVSADEVESLNKAVENLKSLGYEEEKAMSIAHENKESVAEHFASSAD